MVDGVVVLVFLGDGGLALPLPIELLLLPKVSIKPVIWRLLVRRIRHHPAVIVLTVAAVEGGINVLGMLLAAKVVVVLKHVVAQGVAHVGALKV